MRLLLVKTSSMGDVIHALPAVTDAQAAVDGLCVDWLVEESFAEIPGWHPAVDRVIPVSMRGWRKNPDSAEIRQSFRALRQEEYDLVLDAQGLYKSAMLASLARGPRAGYDRSSAREPLASVLYKHKVAVDRELHAVERVRRLAAGALGYAPPETPPDYGLHVAARSGAPYVVLLHGTTWASKHWPEAHWTELARRAADAGYRPLLPSGNDAERARAERVASQVGEAEALPPSDLGGLAARLAGAAGVVAVDTGLAHLAAALDVPGVALYGPTSATLTGTSGPRQSPLATTLDCAPCLLRECPLPAADGVHPPCFAELTPERVWSELAALIG